MNPEDEAILLLVAKLYENALEAAKKEALEAEFEFPRKKDYIKELYAEEIKNVGAPKDRKRDRLEIIENVVQEKAELLKRKTEIQTIRPGKVREKKDNIAKLTNTLEILEKKEKISEAFEKSIRDQLANDAKIQAKKSSAVFEKINLNPTRIVDETRPETHQLKGLFVNEEVDWHYIWESLGKQGYTTDRDLIGKSVEQKMGFKENKPIFPPRAIKRSFPKNESDNKSFCTAEIHFEPKIMYNSEIINYLATIRKEANEDETWSKNLTEWIKKEEENKYYHVIEFEIICEFNFQEYWKLKINSIARDFSLLIGRGINDIKTMTEEDVHVTVANLAKYAVEYVVEKIIFKDLRTVFEQMCGVKFGGHQTLGDVKFGDVKLGDVNFADVNLDGNKTLSDVKLGTSKLVDVKFGDVKFANTTLRATAFADVNLDGNKTLSDVKLGTSKLVDVKFGDVKLEAVNFGDVTLGDSKTLGEVKLKDGNKLDDFKLVDVMVGAVRFGDVEFGDIRLTDVKLGDNRITPKNRILIYNPLRLKLTAKLTLDTIDNAGNSGAMKFAGAYFGDVEFNGVKFGDVKLSDVEFNGVKFTDAELNGAKLFGKTTFDKFELGDNKTLDNLRLVDVRLDGYQKLGNYRLLDAKLGNYQSLADVRFGDVRLADVRFGDVRLADVRFGDVNFGDVNFGDVKIRRKIDGAKLRGGKNLGNLKLGGDKLVDFKLVNVMFNGSKFGEIKLSDLKFGGKRLGDAKFDNVKFGNVKSFDDKPEINQINLGDRIRANIRIEYEGKQEPSFNIDKSFRVIIKNEKNYFEMEPEEATFKKGTFEEDQSSNNEENKIYYVQTTAKLKPKLEEIVHTTSEDPAEALMKEFGVYPLTFVLKRSIGILASAKETVFNYEAKSIARCEKEVTIKPPRITISSKRKLFPFKGQQFEITFGFKCEGYKTFNFKLPLILKGYFGKEKPDFEAIGWKPGMDNGTQTGYFTKELNIEVTKSTEDSCKCRFLAKRASFPGYYGIANFRLEVRNWKLIHEWKENITVFPSILDILIASATGGIGLAYVFFPDYFPSLAGISTLNIANLEAIPSIIYLGYRALKWTKDTSDREKNAGGV